MLKSVSTHTHNLASCFTTCLIHYIQYLHGYQHQLFCYLQII
uniref:Uncharacterized protein n=1 Tax=Anguilla anguilla TaxID=7936 RepID=A0A0E9TJM4_ANGAN